jgi:hypothetical protein
MKELTFKEYETGDENAIAALFEKVFKKPMGGTDPDKLRHWRWEFESNPVKPISICLAWDKDRLVGQYAVNPIRAWVSGKQIIGGLSLDTMTDPEYSGKGIFQKAAKSLYADLIERGVAFVFGFPNVNSIHGFKEKLAWNMISVPPIYVCPVSPIPMTRKTCSALLKSICFKTHGAILKRRLSKLKKDNPHVTIRKDVMFDGWADELWQQCRNQHDIWVIRDATYLRWRYNDRPDTSYEYYTAWHEGKVAGYVVTVDTMRDEGPVTFILDIVADLKEVGIADALIEAVLRSSIEKNIALVSTIVMPGSPYKTTFLKNCFLPLPRMLFPQKLFFGVNALVEDPLLSIVLKLKSWHLSWGDTDLL